MKILQKLAIVSAALVIAASSVPTSYMTSYATSDDGKITVNYDVSNHTFKAYQLFKGDVSSSGDTLSNVEKGSAYPSDASSLINEIKSTFSISDDISSPADLAKAFSTIQGKENSNKLAQIITKYVNGSGTDLTYTSSSYTAGNLETGYYIIIDESGNISEAKSKSILLLVKSGDNSVTPKIGTPTVEKKVKSGDSWNDAASASIGDTIDFQVTGTLPDSDRWAEYDTYKYAFTDTLSEGLDLVMSGSDPDVSVKYGETDVKEYFDVTYDSSSRTLKVSAKGDNLKGKITYSNGTKIVVSYKAKLNSNASIGVSGNSNSVKLEYSNNPDGTGSGTTGTTTEDTNKVYSYQLEVTKKDSNNSTPLENAEFKLKNSEGKWAKFENNKFAEWVTDEGSATTLKTGSDGIIKMIGLAEGDYTLKETKAPDGYELPSKEFAIKVTATYNNTYIDNLSGTIDSSAMTAEKSDGKLSGTITNTKGSSLPTTGGIGTRVFYIGGGILVIGAGTLLIAKKRMKNYNK